MREDGNLVFYHIFLYVCMSSILANLCPMEIRHTTYDKNPFLSPVFEAIEFLPPQIVCAFTDWMAPNYPDILY